MEKKTKRVVLQVSESEYSEIATKMLENGYKNMSRFIRDIIMNREIKKTVVTIEKPNETVEVKLNYLFRELEYHMKRCRRHYSSALKHTKLSDDRERVKFYRNAKSALDEMDNLTLKNKEYIKRALALIKGMSKEE